MIKYWHINYFGGKWRVLLVVTRKNEPLTSNIFNVILRNARTNIDKKISLSDLNRLKDYIEVIEKNIPLQYETFMTMRCQ